MLVRIHNTYRDIVAICDSELIGKLFVEDKFQLDVKESFFKGNEKTRLEVLEIMQDMAKEDATFNIIGKEATELAIEAGIITQEGIRKIQGIPFALVLL